MVSDKDSVHLSVNEVLEYQSQNKDINFRVANLEIFPEADNVRIFENKSGNNVLEYKKGDKILASCFLSGEDHLVCLYKDNGFYQYINYADGHTKEFRKDMEYPVSQSLHARIHNIASFSKALCSNTLKRISNNNKNQTIVSQIQNKFHNR